MTAKKYFTSDQKREAKRLRDQRYRAKHAAYVLEWHRAYYARNKEKLVQWGKDYYEKNKESCLNRGKNHREANREHYKEYNKAYHANHREDILKKQKEYREKNKEKLALSKREFVVKNRDKVVSKIRKWQLENPHIVREASKRNKTRRVGSLHPCASVEKMRLTYKDSDRITEKTGIRQHVDHIIPIFRGGWHHEDNLQVIPWHMNSEKGRKPFWISRSPEHKDWRDVPATLWPKHLRLPYLQLIRSHRGQSFRWDTPLVTTCERQKPPSESTTHRILLQHAY